MSFSRHVFAKTVAALALLGAIALPAAAQEQKDRIRQRRVADGSRTADEGGDERAGRRIPASLNVTSLPSRKNSRNWVPGLTATWP